MTTAGTYNLTVIGVSGEPRTFHVSANGGSAKTVDLSGPTGTAPPPRPPPCRFNSSTNSHSFNAAINGVAGKLDCD